MADIKVKKVRINDEEVIPINKVKLWELEGWTPGRIRRLIEKKQEEVKAKFAAEAAANDESSSS